MHLLRCADFCALSNNEHCYLHISETTLEHKSTRTVTKHGVVVIVTTMLQLFSVLTSNTVDVHLFTNVLLYDFLFHLSC